MVNVRSYTDKELIGLVKALPTFKKIPIGYWILGIRSKVDEFNTFDDKFYIFLGEKFVDVMSGTTNAGADGLLNFDRWGLNGSAFIKADECYYDVWTRGKHKGKMNALVQTGGFKVIRDSNKNKKAGDLDKWSWEYVKGLNFHTNTYDMTSKIIKWTIGLWSLGCQVVNDTQKYAHFMNISKPQNKFTYILIQEK